jgi:hypothetical protein
LEKLGDSKQNVWIDLEKTWKSLEKAWKKLGRSRPVSRETNRERQQGFKAAIDALGPLGTGEIAGTGLSSAVPQPSTWAMMILGFAGLAFAGYRRSKKSAANLAA